MCISFCTFVISLIAPPSAAFGARLKDTVIAGNCPWCIIDSASVVVSKCENALNGTALLKVELVVPAEVAPLLEFAFTVLDVSALIGGVNVFADAVNKTELVRAFDPADVEPLPDYEVAAAPVVPEADPERI
jgi:hypothetical protein